MVYRYIDQQSELDTCIDILNKSRLLAMDTEFMREYSYFPALSLVQVSDGDTTFLIDAQARLDYSALARIIADPDTVKIFHASKEDVETLKYAFKVNPAGIVDTQVMALFCGLGFSVGLNRLVESFAGIKLDKGLSRSNWGKRPLPQTLLTYAAQDVLYLHSVYDNLLSQLNTIGLTKYALAESYLMTEEALEERDGETEYIRVSNSWRLNERQLYVLYSLAKWRNEFAKTKNVARPHLVKDDLLWQLAFDMPESSEAIEKSFKQAKAKTVKFKAPLIDCLQRALSEAGTKPAVFRVCDIPAYKEKLKIIRNNLAGLCEKNALPAEAFFSKKRLEKILKLIHEGAGRGECFGDWRQDIVTDEAFAALVDSLP